MPDFRLVRIYAKAVDEAALAACAAGAVDAGHETANPLVPLARPDGILVVLDGPSTREPAAGWFCGGGCDDDGEDCGEG